MNLSDYLFNLSPGFGPLAVVFLLVQIGLLVGGLYVAFARRDAHPVRGPLLQRLGYIVAAFGAIGVVFSVLRITELLPERVWMYVIALFEVIVAIVVLYYRQAVYPAQVAQAAAKTGRRSPTAPRTSQQQARAAKQAPRPVISGQTEASGRAVPLDEQRVASGRRDSRRDRKRRNR